MVKKEGKQRKKRNSINVYKGVLKTNLKTEQHREVHNGWLHRSLCSNVVVRSTASSTAIKKSSCIIQSCDFQTLSGYCCKPNTLKRNWV